jgi:hypothetical protein
MAKCGQCGKDNKETAKFCTGCGAKLRRFCPQCGAVATADARFCMACGTSLSVTSSGTNLLTGQGGTSGGDAGVGWTKEMALKRFSSWYEECIESGIEPEEIVSRMGGVALVTDEELVNRLQDSGDIPAY